MLRYSLAVGGICLLAAAATAGGEAKGGAMGEMALGEGIVGGTITDGVNEWAVTGPSVTDGALTDYTIPAGGTDHQFSTWWWYRVAGDSAETQMPAPDTESFAGNLAFFTWADVDGRGLFSATYIVEIFNTPPGSTITQRLIVTNLSGSNLDLDVFSYTDMDMEGSALDDSATEGAAETIEITEVSTSRIASTADAFRVAAFPAVRNSLNDGSIDNFADTGLPFGPGDYSGALQWGRVIPAGVDYVFFTANCIDADCDLFADVFSDDFETGDTANWTSSVP